MRRLELGVSISLIAGISLFKAYAQTPVFRSDVRLVIADVVVVDGAGRPVRGLEAKDFVAKVDGDTQVVQTVDFLQFGMNHDGDRSAVEAKDSLSVRGSLERAGAQTFLLLFDDLSFPPTASKGLQSSADRVLRQLDVGALAGVSTTSGLVSPLAPTRDRRALTEAIRQLVGRNVDSTDPFYISISEAVSISRGIGVRGARGDIYRRECQVTDAQCPARLKTAAQRLFIQTQRRFDEQITAVVRAIEIMRGAPMPRVVVLLSNGMALDAASDLKSSMDTLSRTAGAAGVHLYALFEAADEEAIKDQLFERAQARQAETTVLSDGLQSVAAASGGHAFRVIGTADRFFSRIVSETSAIYRLGIAVPRSSPPDAALRVSVRVKRNGAFVRSTGRAMSGPVASGMSRDDMLLQRLQQGGASLGDQLQVTTQLRKDSAANVQILLDTRVAERVPLPASLLFGLVDEKGVMVFSGRKELPAEHLARERQLLLSIPVPPGRYRLRCVIGDATNRIGSLELPVNASLARFGDVQFSDLLTQFIAPDVRGGYSSGAVATTSATAVNATLEIYFRSSAQPQSPPSVHFSLSRLEEGVALLTASSTASLSSDRWIAASTIPIDTIASGSYLLRATVTQGEVVLGSQSRTFAKR